MIDFTKEELEKLADGLAPQYVREGLDCETVIVSLARFVLSVGDIVRHVQGLDSPEPPEGSEG